MLATFLRDITATFLRDITATFLSVTDMHICTYMYAHHENRSRIRKLATLIIIIQKRERKKEKKRENVLKLTTNERATYACPLLDVELESACLSG